MLCRLHSVYKIATAYTLWYYTEALKLLYSKVPTFHVQSWKNYTGQKKFTQAPPVVPVTNRRYAYKCICSCEVLKLSKARNGLEEWTRSRCASIGLSSLTAISRVVLFIKILEGSIPLSFSFLQDFSPPKSPNRIKYPRKQKYFSCCTVDKRESPIKILTWFMQVGHPVEAVWASLTAHQCFKVLNYLTL